MPFVGFNYRRLKAIVLLWMMLVVLLSAQWMGYSHRVSHFNLSSGKISVLVSNVLGQATFQALEQKENDTHSCLLFDAASIFDGLQHSLAISIHLPISTNLHIEASDTFQYVQIQLAYLSRAPPSSQI